MVYDFNCRLIRAENANGRLHNLIDKERSENIRLCETVKDYRRVQKVLGEAQTDIIINKAKRRNRH